jgi:hypothetical protein
MKFFIFGSFHTNFTSLLLTGRCALLLFTGSWLSWTEALIWSGDGKIKINQEQKNILSGCFAVWSFYLWTKSSHIDRIDWHGTCNEFTSPYSSEIHMDHFQFTEFSGYWLIYECMICCIWCDFLYIEYNCFWAVYSEDFLWSSSGIVVAYAYLFQYLI